MRFLHGLHDEGGEALHEGRPGWTLISEEVGLDTKSRGRDYSHLASQGIGVIVRLNFSHQGKGTIPLPPKYLDFAAACASFTRTSKGVEWWIIGNEPNHEGEAPEGVTPTPEEYARCFKLCRDAIKRSTLGALVMPAAVAPFSANFLPWHQYLKRVYLALYQDTSKLPCDGLNFHAYTRGMDPANLFSEAMMGGVLEGTHSGFLAILDAFNQVPRGLLDLPAFITEFDAYGAWEDKDTGLITAFYDWLEVWNHKTGLNDLPKVAAGIVFRWSGKNDIDWRLEDKPELQKDFRRAATKGYLSPSFSPSSGSTVFLPSLEKEGDSMAPEIAIDPRIRGEITIIEGSPSPSGEVWDAVEIKWFDHTQSGGRHHVYVEFLGEANQSLVGQPFKVVWPSGEQPLTSNGRLGFDATNQPFSTGRGAFSVVVPNGDTVRGLGMGEMTPSGFNAGEHTAYVVTYKRRIAKQAPPSVKPPVIIPTPPPTIGLIPPLANPVENVKYRWITQEFGARPDFYKAYQIDGVPLKGHEGLDYGTPKGSRIVAVDGGVVTEVGDQGEEGYGRWIKIVHEWGETVYAHLEEQWVKVGDSVTKAQVIGLSGDTGNTDGAHLHFGMRVKPFNRQDGWGGYTNPLPYLAGLSTGPTTVPELSPSPRSLVSVTREMAEEYGLDWRLLVSLVHGESSYNPLALNQVTGAAGLGQLTPLTWGEWSIREGVSDIYNPQHNLKVTAAYLRWCLGLVEGNERKAIWCYNWSPRDVPLGLVPPNATLEFASKVLHGKEVLALGGL